MLRLAIGVMLLSSLGCSAARQAYYSSRYIPPARTLSYDEEHEQLTELPPALGVDRPAKTDQFSKPMMDNRRDTNSQPYLDEDLHHRGY